MKTNDSLGYAFIEFETEESCIEAYNKMNNVLIDDRRIKVDFSQSVSKLWNKFLLKPKQEKQEHVIKKPIKQQVVSAPVATKQPAAHGRSHGDHYGETRGADRRHEGRDSSRDGSKQRHRRSRSRSRSRDRHSGHRARSRSPQRKYSDTRDRDRRDEGRRR
jgi:peptidyl-prolyl cis-trans isomerase-like 4